eukprot:TRINITY_DN11869_c3_g1_i1.p1 TRINITY_DN11869_c3_g1~~TRINITY_DN11869_c3_g1_i1.p1  ORF type:complete len:467 (+),score=55.01 TRINITY_DN11869_c3_g1_i1:111-1403(+)
MASPAVRDLIATLTETVTVSPSNHASNPTSLYASVLPALVASIEAKQSAPNFRRRFSRKAKSHMHRPCAILVGNDDRQLAARPTETAPNTAGTASLTASQRMLSSGTGAVITSVTMTPFDVVKTRLQAQNQPTRPGCLPEYYCGTVEAGPICTYCGKKRLRLNGTLDAFIKIFQHEGARSLWRGMIPTLVMAVPGTVIYFSTYDILRDTAAMKTSAQLAPVLSGATARVFAATIVSPLELVRTKMQAGQSNYSELFSTVQRSIQSEGYRVLWRGLGPTLLRDVPFSAMYWYGYEAFRSRLSYAVSGADFDFDHPSMPVAFAAGALSGSIAATLTLPFDVIKTRQQSLLGQHMNVLATEGVTGGSVSATVPQPFQKESALYIAKDVYRQHGLRGLWTGLTPRIAKVAPACAIMISTYEYSKRFFRQQNAAE